MENQACIEALNELFSRSFTLEQNVEALVVEVDLLRRGREEEEEEVKEEEVEEDEEDDDADADADYPSPPRQAPRSPLHGVVWSTASKKWQGYISASKRLGVRKLHLGVFDTEREAGEAYDRVAIERMRVGSNAHTYRLNFHEE